MERSLHSHSHNALIAELRKLRRNANLTQQVIADRLGLPQSYIAKIETGERNIDVVELLDLCDALGAKITDVLSVVIEARKK